MSIAFNCCGSIFLVRILKSVALQTLREVKGYRYLISINVVGNSTASLAFTHAATISDFDVVLIMLRRIEASTWIGAFMKNH